MANVLTQAAAGLEYLHGRRTGHGCVSLHTLFVGPDGRVLFGDFLGHRLGGRSVPTPDPCPTYLAPEYLSGGRTVPSSDLYALGYAALELLSGPRFGQLFDLPPGSDPLVWHADQSKPLANWRSMLSHVPPRPARCERRLPAYMPGG